VRQAQLPAKVGRRRPRFMLGLQTDKHCYRRMLRIKQQPR